MNYFGEDILSAQILIVDDKQTNIHILVQLLTVAGYKNLYTTMDPSVVCEWHKKNQYDLIILDLKMPIMDGFSVLEGLKASTSDGYLPVLVITAQPGHKLRALQAGAKDFISKPFDLVEVKTRIYNMLEVRLLYNKLEHHNKALELAVSKRTAELYESEERYRRLVDLASDWYWEQDAEENFTKISGPVLDVLGVVDSSVGVTSDKKEYFGWNKKERTRLLKRISNRQPFLDLLLSRVNTDGTEQRFRVSGEPIFNQASRFIGYRGVGIECSAHFKKKNVNNNASDDLGGAHPAEEKEVKSDDSINSF